ncbi:LuxR C-terminal-related transcriptional regulator [Massilia sp. G4R7]|uniref:LuxR C-terminal-related transcriptional regulator n=1 Tax=Massilia phyllostachyos TaxID=2898585 RepID=A0ABS8QDU2_9BURK|nr:LuxR C-terminal-related transcriptional regulator [Massilia phyllostachyos]MCD2518900.1 LuxR C-terminal-related transcriptional regulator [Massilia phyllostachyos]
MVILSKLEQEYLLRTIESGIELFDLRALFLWAQGPLQALLPHEAMLCLQLDASGAVVRSECLHRAVLDGAALTLLARLGEELAAAWRAGPGLPAVLDPVLPGGQLSGCAELLRESGFENVLVHGSAPLEGGATLFALFGLPLRPGPRQGHFLQLLLPYLHLGLLRAPARTRPAAATAVPARPLSARELAILACLRAGRSNEEAGEALGISALTVKNHLQRIYRALGVANRAHAVARCLELRLL